VEKPHLPFGALLGGGGVGPPPPRRGETPAPRPNMTS
jgi:hypothetical protein